MTDPSDTIPPQRLRVMQILATALILGSVIACAVCAFIVYQNNGQGQALQQGLPFMSLLAGFTTLTNTLLSIAVPLVQVRAAVRRIATGTWQPAPNMAAVAFPTDTLKLLVVRQTSMIGAFALLEGAAFFCSVAYLIEGQVYVLAGVAVSVALMLANFPTAGGVRAWLGRQLEAVRQAREEVAPAD